MDKEQLIKKFEMECVRAHERLDLNKEQIKLYCSQLGLDPETVTIEQVTDLLNVAKETQKQQEDNALKLIQEYERKFGTEV